MPLAIAVKQKYVGDLKPNKNEHKNLKSDWHILALGKIPEVLKSVMVFGVPKSED